MNSDMHAKAILFDMDGTLVDSTAVVEVAWGRFAESHGLDAGEILAVSHGVKAVETIRLFAPHIDADAASRELADWELTQTQGIVEIAGAASFIESLPGSGYAVVTSAPRDLALVRLGICGIAIPEVVVAAEDVMAGKPDPAPYLAAASRLGVEPRDCIVVEDASAGIQSGIAAGMRVVVVGHLENELTAGLPRIADYTGVRVHLSEDGFTIGFATADDLSPRH